MTWQDLKDILDKIAYSAKQLLNLKGSASITETILYTRTEIVALIDGLTDEFYKAALYPAVNAVLDEVGKIELSVYQTMIYRIATTILSQEKVELKDFIGGASDDTDRVPAYVADIALALGIGINSVNIFPKAGISMATFTIPTTFVAGTAIDTTRYGGAKLQIVVTTKVTTSDTEGVDVVITGLDENGSAWEGIATIPKDHDTDGDPIAITPSGSNLFCASITAITASANKTAGAFRVESVDDRTLS
jgi:hypothetical protein